MNHLARRIPARQIAYSTMEMSVALNGRGLRTSACLISVAGSNIREFMLSYFQAICEFIYRRVLNTGPEPMHARPSVAARDSLAVRTDE